WFKLKLISPSNGSVIEEGSEIIIEIDDDEKPVIHDLGSGPHAEADGPITALSGQSDGKVIIGGGFSRVNGIGRHNLARLNANGSLDETFMLDSQIAFPPWRSPKILAMQTDGKLLIGGLLTFASDLNQPFSMARLNADGSLDKSFATERLAPPSAK